MRGSFTGAAGTAMVGKVEAYAALGAALKNERWAWSGHSADENTVVVTLWADKMRAVPGGGHRYDLFDAPDRESWRTKRGNRERIRDLLLARERCDGLFRVVVGRANDEGDAMLEGSVYEASDIVMRLIDLDERTGEFSAESA